MRSVHRIAAAGGSLALALLMLPAIPATAGGGCHEPDATEGTGATVALTEMCMSPTVLRVDPGAEVTFVNRDPVMHNLYGLRWGIDQLNASESFKMRFDSSGTYPYACSLHPGMVGAVVVGDGRGTGSVIDLGSVTPVTEAAAAALPAAAPAAASREDSDGASAAPIALGAAAVVVVGAAAFSAGRRRRQTPEA